MKVWYAALLLKAVTACTSRLGAQLSPAVPDKMQPLVCSGQDSTDLQPGTLVLQPVLGFTRNQLCLVEQAASCYTKLAWSLLTRYEPWSGQKLQQQRCCQVNLMIKCTNLEARHMCCRDVQGAKQAKRVLSSWGHLLGGAESLQAFQELDSGQVVGLEGCRYSSRENTCAASFHLRLHVVC